MEKVKHSIVNFMEIVNNQPITNVQYGINGNISELMAIVN